MPTERKARILAVDDDPAVRHMLERILASEGYEVVGVTESAAGLSTAGAALEGVDLVITNSHLPDLSGEQLLAELHRRFPGLPILHLDDLSHALGSGPSRDLPAAPKPFRVDALLAAVAGLVERRA
jgi:DNA-binding response OmpR family regulator